MTIFFGIQVSWTHALRQIVINCYKFHGREDLLPAFSDDDDKNPAGTSSQNKEKVKNRNTTQHHSSINVTNLAANANITTVPISADASASLAAQSVNVCPKFAKFRLSFSLPVFCFQFFQFEFLFFFFVYFI